MFRTVIVLFALASMLSSALVVNASTYTDEWHDAKRDRTVPVRVYLPEKTSDAKIGPPPYPVVLLSHGLGGSREGFPYLGEHWSNHGYIVVAMQHPGSDESVWKKRGNKPVLESMQHAVNQKNAADRVNDVKFVLDELERRNNISNNSEGEPLCGLVNLQQVAIGGHSFGAQTTIASIGRVPYEPEPRLKAAIAMSAAGPEWGNAKNAFQKIKTPILHLTGTKDVSIIRPDVQASDRRVPFDNIVGVDQYLVIFEGGEHSLFSGHKRLRGLSDLEKKYQQMIQELTLLFLDTYLKEDTDARQRLHEADKILGDGATFEMKSL